MSGRVTKSASSSQFHNNNENQSPYRPQTTNVIDKSSIVWKDFLNGVKKRKASVARLKDAALENTNSQSLLKRLLLEVRQITLRLIEDALEIEFRSQISESKSPSKNTKMVKLPPISSFKTIDEKEDVYALSEIISDVDDLFKIPNIRVMLPHEFPNTRNPFMLGKTVDELAYMIPPHPEPGNVEIELKVLELLRYQRAAKALIRAEAQVLNRLPVSLQEVERLLLKMNDDLNLEKLIRCVCTLLDNDRYSVQHHTMEIVSDLKCLRSPMFNVEAHELVTRLNNFAGTQAVRVDVQASVRQMLRDCVFDYLDDNVSAYLLEWVNIVLGRAPSQHASRSSAASSLMNEAQRQRSPQYMGPSLGVLLETKGSRVNSPSSDLQPASLTQTAMIQHDYTDITSVVSMGDERGTHENIHVEAPALLKMRHQDSRQSSSPSAVTRATSPSIAKTSKPNSASRARLAPKSSLAVGVSSDEHAKASVVGNRRIRSEVERVVREMGLLPDIAAKDQDVEKEVSALSDMRFDLYKMQQELLRRHILDPRHYAQNDSTTETGAPTRRRKGAAVVDDSSKNVRHLREASQQAVVRVLPMREIPLALKTVFLHDRSGEATLEVLLDTITESIIGNITITTLAGQTAKDLSTLDGDSPTISRKQPKGDNQSVISASIRVSKLIFNRLTQYLLEDLPAANNDLRGKMLQNIFDQLEARANEVPTPHGFLLAFANRVLFNSVFTEDGVLVDMIILRNDDCSGLVIHCTPLSGLHNIGRQGKANAAGPVSVTVQDCELSVLLINQYGLYMLSRSKWASMELVAQWLSSRVRVRKIRAFVESRDETTAQDNNHALDQKSVNSQVSFDDFTHNNSFDSRVQSELLRGLDHGSSGMIGTPTKTPAIVQLMMLDISLDRRIEISNAVLLQWKSRNVPSIAGMSVSVNASQDLQMLVMAIRITFPVGGDRQNTSDKRGRSKTLDSAELTDEEEEGNEADLAPAIEMTYRLTSAEIAVFGANEMLEPQQQHKKVSLSTNSRRADEKHPETFIWNVFSRLKIEFQGSKTKPYAQSCSAYESENWIVAFNRKLIREIRTVSKRVLLMTVSAVGSELLFEAEAVDSTTDKTMVGSKLMSESELLEMVHSEGWAVSILDFGLRRELAVKCIDKLKIVDINGVSMLEVYTFPETQMLRVTLREGTGRNVLDKDLELGSIEISYHFTLSDLRVLIKHELDFEDLPKQFRFLYKGASCSVKQEPFRRAWECLPRCLIVPKLVETSEISIETDDILHRRMKEQGDKSAIHLPKMVKGQRRVNGKFAAIPVPTLCFVQETSGTIYLLHDSKDMLGPGDILRIGNVTSRDYIVAAADRSEMNSYPKTIRIEPEYDLLDEPQFNAPTQGNFAYPRVNAGMLAFSPLFDGPTCLLLTARQFGCEYEFSDKDSEAASVHSQLLLTEGGVPGEVSLQSSMINTGAGKQNRSRKIKIINQSFADCWLWKCIPLKDDRRPKWRQLYDDGAVLYSYEHTSSDEVERHFRVDISHSYLEILCTDSRCPSLTLHRQRVVEMSSIPLETYTRLAFDRITDWLPQYKKGIERTKFIKLMKDVAAFPDLKRSARVAQIDMFFQREVKSENGIVQKYITYAGFCRLLQDLSLVRFPPKRKIRVADESGKLVAAASDGGAMSERNDDESSVGVGEMDDLVSLSDSIAASERSSVNKTSATVASKGGKEATRLTAKHRAKKQQSDESEKKLMQEEAPLIDPIHVAFAYQKFVLDYIMMYPDWYEAIWREAKLAAMRKEAVPYCAATRIAAKHRGGHDHHLYKFFLRNLIILQANVRRKLSSKKTKALVDILWEDWAFRHRYAMATRMQSLSRRFLKRCWYFKIMQKVKEQQVLIQKARRFRLKKLRQAALHGVIYKEAKRANGVMVFIRVVRKDARNYTKDFGITIEVYTPHSQSRFQFVLEEPELRAYMLMELGVEAISAGDMLDKRNLQRLVASRLIIHKPSSKFGSQQVIFSKHALGQRGEKTVTRAKRIGNEFFVAKIFETGEDLAVQLYHRLTSRIFTCVMTVHEMRNWITEEYKIACRDDELREKTPPVLRPENKKDYHTWILDHLAIDTRRGQFKLLFSCQLLKSQKMQMIVKIQAAMRRALVRPIIVRLLDQFMLKVKVAPTDPNVYYVNRRTGASSWEKPKLLGQLDLPTEPVRKWVQLTYDNGGVSTTHYVNPFTGRYTHLTPQQAARIIQALVRNFLLLPISMSLEQFLKAGHIFKGAESQYTANPTRLAAVINYAMVSHTITLEEDLARRLYGEAVELSEANPLVTRAYAFFMLGTCEAPMVLNRDRAHLLLGDARRKDEDHSKFQTAYYLFKFACLRRPKDFRTLLNLALVQCLLFDQNHNAEKLLRRALALAPFEERVIEIWKYLKDRFPDRQLQYNPQSRVTRINTTKGDKSKRRVVHGRPVAEDSSWAGWCFVEEDKYSVSKTHKGVSYWYNPADGTESLVPPDLETQWAVRRGRSQYTGEVNGMEQYYDPLTAEYFQYHALTETYS